MDFDESAPEQAPAAEAAAAPEPEPAPAPAAPAPAPAETPEQADNPLLAAIDTPLKSLFSRDKEQDEDEGRTESSKTEVKGGIDTAAKTATGEASHTTSATTEDDGGSTKSETSVEGKATVGADGGKADGSVSEASSQVSADGAKTSSSTTVKGDIDVKDGEVSGGGAVSSERAASYEDKDTGENSSRSDKVGADVHVADGDTHAGASYDRARASNDGEGNTTSTKTEVEGHVGEKDSEGKASYASATGTDDKAGDTSRTTTQASGDVKVDAQGNVSGDASASRSSSSETKDGDASTKSETSVKGDASFDEHGGKGDASVTHSDSQDGGDGTKNSSSTTVKGDMQVKDGEVSGGGAVSSERAASTDVDGDKTSRSDKVDAGVHVGDGDSQASAGYDRSRSQDDGAAKTGTTTHVDGHIGEKDSGGSVSQTSTAETKDADGRTTSSQITTSGGVKVDDKGTTIDASRKSSTSEGDGHGATEASSSEVGGKVNVDKSGDVSVDASGKTSKDSKYADDGSPLASDRGASADGSIHVDKDKASVQGGVEAHKSETDEDGETTARSGKVGGGVSTDAKGQTTWNVDAAAKSSQSYADKDAKVAGSTEKSASASVSSGPDKTEVKGDIAAKKTLSDDDTGSAENSGHVGGGVTVDNKGNTTVTATGGVESKQTLKNDDGSSSSSSRKDASISGSSDGSWKAGGSSTNTTEETHKDADGNETKNARSTTVGGTFGQDADGNTKVGVNAGASRTTTNADGTKSTSGVDGGVEVTSGPGKEGVAGHFGIDQDGNRVGVAGGYQQSFGKPTQGPDGSWTVPYTATAAGGVDAGAGKDVKVGGSVSGSSSTFGSRTFANEDEAKAFYEKGEMPSTEVPKTAADAKNLPAGTTIGTSTSAGVGANAGASGGGVGVTAGAEGHESSSVAVTAKGNGVVEVTAGNSTGGSGTVGMSGGPASASVGADKDHSESQKVQFDLNTPEGQAAYDAYLKDPSKVPDKGATVMQKTETDKEGTSWNAGVAGVAMGEHDTYAHTVVKDKDGNVVEDDKKGTNASSVSVPFLGHAKEETSLDVDTKDGKTTYSAHKDIDDTMASDANSALAKATNTTADVNVSGKTAGKWQVDTSYTAAQMDDFAKKVESGEYNKFRGTEGDAAREQLKSDLAQAGDDPDKRKEALAKFTKDGGDAALSQVKDATGADGEHYVKLDGDKYLTGAAGREDLDKQIAAYDKQVNSGAEDPGTVGDVRALLAAQKERQRQISDPANYPELPSGVRAQETARSQADIDRLEQLLGTAKDDRDAFGDPGADPKAQVASGGGDGPRAADPGQPSATPGDPEATAQSRMQANAEAMAQTRADQDKAYADARLQNKIQDGYYSQSPSTPREQFGDKTFGLFDNSETKAYSSADKAYADAQAALREANKQEGAFDRAGDDTPEAVAASADAAQKAAAAHQLAAQKFAEAKAQYEAISARHKDDAEPGSFDGQNHQLKPGE